MKIDTIDIIGQIADLKETNYKNTLAIATLIELLIEKGLFTKHEFTQTARRLEDDTMAEIAVMRRMGKRGIKIF